MSKLKTDEEFREELSSYSKNIILLSEYTGANNRAHFKCLLDGYEWESLANAVLKSLKKGKCACPRCSGKERYTHQQICDMVKKISPNLTILTEYKGICAPLEVKCDIDGHKWTTSAAHLIHDKSGCPKCRGIAKKTTSDFVTELYSKTQSIYTIGEYKGNKTKMLCHCCVCGNEWYASPNSLLKKDPHGCPKCASSKGEKQIQQYFDRKGIFYVPQKSFAELRDKHKLLFDFYVPDKNICIEYDGQQHFFPVSFGGNKDKTAKSRFELTKYHDDLKTQYCVGNGIKLIRIPYTDFDNIESILDKHFS